MKHRFSTACAVLSAAMLSPTAWTQEPAPIQPRLREMVEAEKDPKQEMIELFQAVELRMHRMGSLLLDASAGDTSQLAKAEASGIAEILPVGSDLPNELPQQGIQALLAATHGQGNLVLEEIDRILEIAEQQGGT